MNDHADGNGRGPQCPPGRKSASRSASTPVQSGAVPLAPGRRWIPPAGPSGAWTARRSIEPADSTISGRDSFNSDGKRSTGNFLRAHLVWIGCITLLVLAAAGALSWARTPSYSAHADVAVVPRFYSAMAAPQQPDMGTEKTVASSGRVLDIAAKALAVPPTQLVSGLAVTVPVDTHILRFTYAFRDPAEAARRAEAIADAYVSYWSSQRPRITGGGNATITAADTSVISTAAVPQTPDSPDHTVDLGIALVIGLSIGVGTAMVRDRFDDGLRGPADAELQTGSPLLAALPSPHRRQDGRNPLVLLANPGGSLANAYRDLRTRVLREAAGREANTLLVTSPAGREQVTLAANLAIALAQSGRQVALVCADIRSPSLDLLFGLHSDLGLTDMLQGTAAFGDILLPSPVTNLTVVPAGPAGGDFTSFLHQPRLEDFVATLANRFDFVIVEAPAVLAGADTGSLAELTEMVLLAVDARRTTRSEARAARHELQHVERRLIGAALVGTGRRDFRLARGRVLDNRWMDQLTRQRTARHSDVGQRAANAGANSRA